jgi:hypothetical protein
MANPGGDHTAAYDEPLNATANGPVVVVWGEQGVDIGLTPEAALDSAAAITAAAQQALRNREDGQGPA